MSAKCKIVLCKLNKISLLIMVHLEHIISSAYMALTYFRLTQLSLVVSFLSMLADSLRLPSVRTSSHEDTWSTAVRKGTVLYKQLQSGCFPDIEHPVTLGQLIKQGWHFPEPGTWPPTLGYSNFFSEFEERTFGWTGGVDYYEQPIQSGNKGMWLLSQSSTNPDTVLRSSDVCCCSNRASTTAISA